VLPGSKAVRADLEWLRAQGWDSAIARHLRYGGKLIGLCGGYQMLGTCIADPLGLEGPPGSCPGLGYLPVHTTLAADKQLHNVRGELCLPGRPTVTGYEIHQGVSHSTAQLQPALQFSDGRHDGAQSADGQILATYCHGLFDHPAALTALLAWAGAVPQSAWTSPPGAAPISSVWRTPSSRRLIWKRYAPTANIEHMHISPRALC